MGNTSSRPHNPRAPREIYYDLVSYYHSPPYFPGGPSLPDTRKIRAGLRRHHIEPAGGTRSRRGSVAQAQGSQDPILRAGSQVDGAEGSY